MLQICTVYSIIKKRVSLQVKMKAAITCDCDTGHTQRSCSKDRPGWGCRNPSIFLKRNIYKIFLREKRILTFLSLLLLPDLPLSPVSRTPVSGGSDHISKLKTKFCRWESNVGHRNINLLFWPDDTNNRVLRKMPRSGTGPRLPPQGKIQRREPSQENE